MIKRASYLFIYGTLRTSMSGLLAADTTRMGYATINGTLYDLGDYPGAVPGSSRIAGEVFQLRKPRKLLAILDAYEGFDPKNVACSEYVRRKVTVESDAGETMKAWIYWYNLPVADKVRIEHGDYLKFCKEKQSE